ncbi:DUF6670 family protein [Williamsia sterculiae]|nr:DUF6670 family protein [Williamsia sterculiae]
MTFIGTTGTSAFDNGELAAADVRDNATVLTSTAHDDMYFYRAYDGASDCRFDRDGHHLQWGDNLTWEAEHPVYTITGRYRTFEVDLELRTSEQVSYFVRTPVYDHFSVLAPYVGTITHNGETTEITGLGTIEYGRCVSPQSFARRPLPPRVRLPVDFFTYQVIRIDATTQVLLSNVRVAGGTACLMAHVRSTTRPASVVEKGVTFTVVRYHETHAVDPVGRRMRIPHEIEWYVPGYGHIHGFVDSPLRYGHGLGYVGCYSFTGLWSDEPVSGTGYLEWIDVQHEGSVARGASV